jgi:hypothetical protein
MQKNISIGFIAIIVGSIISGCSSQPKPLYIYGDYSDSYYNFKKNVSQESALKLQKSIEYAIANSELSRSKRVAPGMYANLGYLYLKKGDTDKAIENFKKEKITYPESTHFMDRMIQKIKVAQGENK